MSLDINQIATRMDWGLAVARQQVQRASGLNRFAFIPTIGSVYETVWEAGGTYQYPSSAVAMTITSSAGFADAGVEITISGLDANWRSISETLVLDSVGSATTTKQFIRINESRVSNGVAITGTANITNGGITYSRILPDFGKSLSSVYTVPAGYSAYVLNGDLSIGKQKEVIAKLMVRPFGRIFTSEGIIGSSGVPYQKTWTIPLHLPAKTDIEIRAKASATTEISTSFEILLVELD